MKSCKSNHSLGGKPEGRPLVFRISAIVLGLFAALVFCEIGLRVWQQWMLRYQRQDPGMYQYDSTLGWVLSPGWSGEEHNYDFHCHYTINANGFRHGRADELPGKDRPVVVLGDSFAFGIGVDDKVTFVERLNAELVASNVYINLGVPGYSTDQEALLFERWGPKLRPAAAILIVYLGNDIFDNQLSFPIQASRGKPYFEAVGKNLILRNTPVPKRSKTAEEAAMDLGAAAYGWNPRRPSIIQRLNRLSRVIHMVSEAISLKTSKSETRFEPRFASALELFNKIVDRIQSDCSALQSQFVVVTIAGRSFVEAPRSLSAKYQDYLRGEVIRECLRKGVRTLDAASRMREHFNSTHESLFYPNEGHFNRNGHRMVAEMLKSAYRAN